MKNSNLNIKYLLFVLILATACNNDNEPAATRFEVRLTDSPGDYEEVNIDVQGVEIKVSEDDDESGWTALEGVSTGIYNLLDFTNGKDTVLVAEDLPSGKISQIRLKLGDQNSIKIDGETHDLKTPSGQQSGLKLKINATLIEGISYSVLLDFDAARSVVKAGNSGKFNLKPVIRVITEAVDGAIKGIVSPADASPAVYAIIGEDTLGTSFANEAGEFMILGLDAGAYNVSFMPKSEYVEKTIENVEVVIGNVTDLETIELAQ